MTLLLPGDPDFDKQIVWGDAYAATPKGKTQQFIADADKNRENTNFKYASSMTSPGPGSNYKTAQMSGSSNMMTEPMFFSPLHTAQNWQIASKRREVYLWSFISNSANPCFLTRYGDFSVIDIRDYVQSNLAVDECIQNDKGQPSFIKNASIRTVKKSINKMKAMGVFEPLVVTHDHDCMIIRKQEVKCKFDKKKNCVCGICSATCIRAKCNIFIEKSYEISKVKASEVQKGDYFLVPFPTEIRKSVIRNIHQARFAGHLASDGNGDGQNFDICFNKDEQEFVYPFLKDVMEPFGSEVKKYKCKSDELLRVRCAIKEATKYADSLVKGKKHEKRFTKEVMLLDPSLQLHVLGAYIQSDGTFNEINQNVEITTYSAHLANQVTIMCYRCGILACANKQPISRSKKTFKTKSKFRYLIQIPSTQCEKLRQYCKGKISNKKVKTTTQRKRFFWKNYVITPIVSNESLDYEGLVYDIEVPPTYAITANQIAVHQCRFFYECFTPENMVLMSNGSEKRIDEVIVGDEIIAGNNSFQKVISTYNRTIDEEILKISVNNKTIRCTKNHVIPRHINRYEIETWEAAETLKVKHLLVGESKLHEISKIETEHYSGIVYDLQIENVHSYYVNKCVVHNSEPKVAAAIDFYCFTPDAQVLMADGGQNSISHIEPGDLIRSHDGSINQVVRKFIRKADEEILKIKIAGINMGQCLRTTKGHELLTERGGKIIFIKAGDLTTDDYLLTPIDYEEGQSGFEMDNDFAWLVGVYAAEGCGIPYEHMDKKGVTRQYFKGVYFTLNKEELELAELIKKRVHKIYGSNKVTFRIVEKDGICRVAAYGRNIADDLIGLCPGMSINGTKRLAPLVLKWHNKTLKHLLAGFLAGDGCFNKGNGFQGLGVSKKLAEQVANICDRLGIEYSFTATRPNSENRQVAYNVRISRRACNLFSDLTLKIKDNQVDESHIRHTPYFKKGKYIFRKIYKIEPVSYEGSLYDLEIENSHSYVVNRISCHNSRFPMNGFNLSCQSNKILSYYQHHVVDKLKLNERFKEISSEYFMIGDVFIHTDIKCDSCQGTGTDPETHEVCNHEGGTFRRVFVMNPDWMEVQRSPLSDESLIVMMPDEELQQIVHKRSPKAIYDRIPDYQKQLILARAPMPMSPRTTSHLKHMAVPYGTYGTSIIRRLFTTLAYKTKIMTANWIIAERLILPVRVVQIGSDDRPASTADIADVQQQLAAVANDPNLTLITHHNFSYDWFGTCYDDQTEVLTNNGFKKFEQVNIEEDNIACYDLELHKIDYLAASEKQEYDYDGNMYHFLEDGVDIKVTPNHTMLCKWKGQKWQKIQADRISSGMRFLQVEKQGDNDSIDITRTREIRIDAPSKSHYKGKVWCLTVPTGFFVTRRNGMITVQGNSGKILQVTQEMEHIDKELLDGLMLNQALLNGEMCLPPDHEVLTVKGYIPIDQVKGNTKVAVWRQNTNTIKFEPIKNKFKYDKVEFLYEIKNGETTLFKCSAKHKILIKKKSQDGINQKLEIITAEDLHASFFECGTLDKDGNYLPITSIEKVKYGGTVYCIETSTGYFIARYKSSEFVSGNSGYQSAQVGVETLIRRIESWRHTLAEWAEERIFKPIAEMQGFIDEKKSNEVGETVYLHPEIKWNDLELKDKTQFFQLLMQLHDKQVISTQTLLEEMDLDYDQEVKRMRYEQAMLGPAGAMLGQGGAGAGGAGAAGGAGGGAPAGGMAGGAGNTTGDMGGLGGGGMPGMGMSPDGGGGMAGGGGAPGGGATAGAGGKITKKGKANKQEEQEPIPMLPIKLTSIEQKMAAMLVETANNMKFGADQIRIQYPFENPKGGKPYSMDFAIPALKINFESDGEIFHQGEEQEADDKERDYLLAQRGWTVLRFDDKAIEEAPQQVSATIYSYIQKAMEAMKGTKKASVEEGDFNPRYFIRVHGQLKDLEGNSDKYYTHIRDVYNQKEELFTVEVKQ